jgi:GcrA cell cycle regulator
MWTPETINKLLTLALATEPYSASQIADELGVTRNSVIGKLSRMGVNLPRSTGRKRVLRSQETIKLVHSRLIQKPAPRAPAAASGGLASPFKICQWYFGDPKAGDLSKCNHSTYGNSSFCEEHYRRAYIPVAQKPRNKP